MLERLLASEVTSFSWLLWCFFSCRGWVFKYVSVFVDEVAATVGAS